MSTSNKLPTNVIRILVETGSGVTEYVLRVFEQDGGIALQTIGVRLASGSFCPVSAEQLQEAFMLRYWADQHREVFADGRVSP
jgi:hypothetical protein